MCVRCIATYFKSIIWMMHISKSTHKRENKRKGVDLGGRGSGEEPGGAGGGEL